MALDRRTIVRYSIAAFWLGIAAIVCGIVSFATLNSELLLLYFLFVMTTLVGLIVLRCKAGGPLNCNWAIWATVLPCVFLGLSIFLIPFSAVANFGHIGGHSSRSLKKIADA